MVVESLHLKMDTSTFRFLSMLLMRRLDLLPLHWSDIEGILKIGTAQSLTDPARILRYLIKCYVRNVVFSLFPFCFKKCTSFVLLWLRRNPLPDM